MNLQELKNQDFARLKVMDITLDILRKAKPTIIRLAREIQKAGGRLLLVGGKVRDILLRKTPDNIDVEVYGLSASKVRSVAKKYGRLKEVGTFFGVLKIFTKSKLEIDISLPRSENKIAPGHKGFAVRTDPFMDIKKALSRRDFTINSMALDPLTGELIDPLKGQKDLKSKILRATNKRKFSEDPLRVLRAVQLAGRLNLKIESGTKKVIKKNIKRLDELSPDRILNEWRKLLVKSKDPQIGINLAKQLGIYKNPYFQKTLKKSTRLWKLTVYGTLDRPKSIIRGRQLLKVGIKPGPNMGKIIRIADKLKAQKGYNAKNILALIKSISQNTTEEQLIKKLNKLVKGN